MKTQKDSKPEQKKDRPQRKVTERFFVKTKQGVRPMTDEDTTIEGVYAVLPRYADSKVVGAEVASVCEVTKTRFICVLPEQKQKDGTWKAVMTVHPVILRRQLLALERRQSQLAALTSRHGEAFAGLFAEKKV